MNWSRGVAALLVFVTIGVARADDEQIFRLKNGRRIQGELVQETGAEYVVKTSTGTVRIAKSTVLSVDKIVKAKPFLEPKKPGEPEPEPPKKVEKPVETPPAVAPVNTQTPPPAPAPANAALATPEQIAAAKKALLELGPPTASDEEGRAARAKAIAALLEKHAVPVVVAVLAEQGTALAHETPEHEIAAEVVATQPAKARPLLAQGIAAADFEKAVPAGMLLAASKLEPDRSAPALEDALAQKLVQIVEKGHSPAVLGAALSKVGTIRSLPALYKVLLDRSTKLDIARVVAAQCLNLVSSLDDADVGLAPLASAIDGNHLPELGHLTVALELMSESPGGMVRKVSEVLDALARAGNGADARACTIAALTTLSRIPTMAARERILRTLDTSIDEGVRLAVFGMLGRLKPIQGWPPHELLASLATLLERPNASEEETKAVIAALEALTGKKLGTEAGVWKAYVESLRD